jgi:hypothetical protein
MAFFMLTNISLFWFKETKNGNSLLEDIKSLIEPKSAIEVEEEDKRQE